MTLTELTAISPIDGRYASKTASLRPYFSEYALMYYRVQVEIRWLEFLAEQPDIPAIKNTSDKKILTDILEQWDLKEAQRIKAIEASTNHDVKAVEYYIREKLQTNETLKTWIPFVHFACTSEDINNLAYALMIQAAREQILLPQLDTLINQLQAIAHTYADLPMLSRTHGQAASPTTLGKEVANFAFRLKRQCEHLADIPCQGKFGGAVGNYNAHKIAYPDIDWLEAGKGFVESLGLHYNPYTTQIEPHDYIAEIAHNLTRINTILIDFARDVWGYISLGYFQQAVQADEVGSSTMPHKVNPIDFENAEGNLGLANALLGHFAEKLPISRWQRDLSDSTVQRHLGVAFAHCLLAYQALTKGINKLQANQACIQEDLDNQWAVLAEAIQTVMRRYGDEEAYEALKSLTRGKILNQTELSAFIENLELPESMKSRLKNLKPSDYTGLAESLATKIGES